MAPYQRDSSQPYNQTLVEDLHDRLSRLGAPPAKAGLVWKPSSRSRRTKAAFAAKETSLTRVIVKVTLQDTLLRISAQPSDRRRAPAGRIVK